VVALRSIVALEGTEMPPVMLLALLGAVGIAGYRMFSSRLGAPKSARRHGDAEMRNAARTRDLGNLEWDEGSGVYRPSTKPKG
jgi:hypothetical protein